MKRYSLCMAMYECKLFKNLVYPPQFGVDPIVRDARE